MIGSNYHFFQNLIIWFLKCINYHNNYKVNTNKKNIIKKMSFNILYIQYNL